MICLITIMHPTYDWGDLITNYNGMNKKILKSEQKQTHQKVKLLPSKELNGGEEAICCFKFNLLNRNFLMVLDQEKLYEIIEEASEKVYVRLTESWFYILRTFEENGKIVTQISLSLHYLYTQQAEYIEHFELQLNMRNEEKIKEWFGKIRNQGEE